MCIFNILVLQLIPCILTRLFLRFTTAILQGLSNKKQQGQRSLADTKKGGLAYQIDFSAADPELYIPGDTPPKPKNFSDLNSYPPGVPLPLPGRDNGNALIKYARFNDASTAPGTPSENVKVESLMPSDLYLGQIVPFEIKISVSGLDAPTEDGNMTFTAGWWTQTTSGGEFGYDFATYGVLHAFVDTGDGAHVDNGDLAEVSAFSWTYENDDEIQGVFEITGLDDGDEIVVEVWVVIQESFPSAGATGNVHSRLISARTLTTEDTINTGTQTVPMMKSQEVGPLDDTQSRLGTSSVNGVNEDLLCL
jgi:hypothetical protein